MKAIVLCAGYGTRLYPLTKSCAKPLLPVAGEALLTHLIAKLETVNEIDDVLVVTNGRFYGDFCRWRGKVKTTKCLHVFNDQTMSPETRLGAIRDLKIALEVVGSEDTLVIAGDNLFDSGLEPFLQFARSKKPAVSICVYDVKDRSLATQYGLVKTDSSGKIIDFLEKPKDPPSTLVSMGLYFLTKESLGYIDRFLEEHQRSDAPGFYIAWLSKQIETYAFVCDGTWFDIGDAVSYQKADRFYRKLVKKQQA